MNKAILLGGLALLASCEAVVNVPAPAHTPQLSLLYTLSNQPITTQYSQDFSGRSLYVSTSLSTLATTRLQGRADATVELRDASGQVVEEFRPDTSRYAQKPTDYRYGAYIPVRNYVGVPGQAYLLRASAPGVAALEATLTLPAPATVAEASFVTKPQVVVPGSYQSLFDYYGQLSFAILDPVATTDYYVAYARVLDAAGQFWGYVYQDYSLRNQNGPDINLNRFDLSSAYDVYKILPVSDAGRNGQRLAFSNPVGFYYSRPYYSQNPTPPPPPAYLELIVSSVPADTYAFYQSVQRYYDTNGNPFAEPAPLRSNLPGGYGLFGGATDTRLRIAL